MTRNLGRRHGLRTFIIEADYNGLLYEHLRVDLKCSGLGYLSGWLNKKDSRQDQFAVTRILRTVALEDVSRAIEGFVCRTPCETSYCAIHKGVSMFPCSIQPVLPNLVTMKFSITLQA